MRALIKPVSALTGALPYGQFFGCRQSRHEVPGFSISLLTPAFRAEEVPLHTHQNASLVLVLSGAYVSNADGAKRTGSAPMLIFNPAGTVHRDSFALAEGRFLAVSVSDKSLQVALDLAVLPGAAKAYSSGELLTAAMRLARQSAMHPPANAMAMEAICWEMVAIVCGVKMWRGKSAPSWMARAREMLHEPGSETLPIADLAQQLGVHPVYFARAFRKVFRCTPAEYRMRCRLRDALQLVRNSSRSLAEVALLAGFYDQSHFSSAFRQHFGASPQAYRTRLAATEVQFFQDRA